MVSKNCSTGITPSGQTPKTLVEEMVPLLDNRDVQYVDVILRFLLDAELVRHQKLQQSSSHRAIYPVS